MKTAKRTLAEYIKKTQYTCYS